MSRTDPQLAELEARIAETREALGQTVEELAAKADVPGRMKAKAQDTAERLRGAEHRTRERALQARDRTSERAALTAGKVRHSAGAAKSHLPGRGNGKAGAAAGRSGGATTAEGATTDGAAPAGTSTELTPTGDTGAHRVGPETQKQSSRAPVAAGACVALAVVLALVWARRHDFASHAAPPPPPERVPWRIRASSRVCVPSAD